MGLNKLGTKQLKAEVPGLLLALAYNVLMKPIGIRPMKC